MKILRCRLHIILIFKIITASSVFAQSGLIEWPDRLIGQYVRVIAPTVSQNPIKGQLVTVQVDSIVIRTTTFAGSARFRNKNIGIPRDTVTHLSVRTHVKRHWKKGMGFGFLTGATMSVSLVALASPEPGSFFAGTERELAIFLGIVVITPAITLAGTLVGLGFKSETWEEVKAAPLSIGIKPLSQGNLALWASFHF